MLFLSLFLTSVFQNIIYKSLINKIFAQLLYNIIKGMFELNIFIMIYSKIL